MSWRTTSAKIIREVLEATKGQDEKAIRKALRDAYPWGERAMWPYKVWCDEVRAQRGLKVMPARRAAIKAGQQTLPIDFQT